MSTHLDFSSQAHYVVALLPELVLSAWAMVVLVAGVSDRTRNSPDRVADLGWLSLLGILLAALVNGWLYGVTEVGSSAMVAVDSFRLFANWIFLAAAACP